MKPNSWIIKFNIFQRQLNKDKNKRKTLKYYYDVYFHSLPLFKSPNIHYSKLHTQCSILLHTSHIYSLVTLHNYSTTPIKTNNHRRRCQPGVVVSWADSLSYNEKESINSQVRLACGRLGVRVPDTTDRSRKMMKRQLHCQALDRQ